jgi:hypothetical protein
VVKIGLDKGVFEKILTVQFDFNGGRSRSKKLYCVQMEWVYMTQDIGTAIQRGFS